MKNNRSVLTSNKVLTTREPDSPSLSPVSPGKRSLLKSKLSKNSNATSLKSNVTFLGLQQKNSSLTHLQGMGENDAVSLAFEYGEMLPKTGIYALPDFKVMLFLKVLTDYHKKLQNEQKYLEAK